LAIVYIIGTPEWWAGSIPDWLPMRSHYLLLYFLSAVLSLPLWNRMAGALENAPRGDSLWSWPHSPAPPTSR
jgi:hypothetical protein